MIFSRVFEVFSSPQWLSIYLKENLGASDENIGLVNATRSGVNVLLQPLGGVVGQRFSKKKLYLVSLLIQASAFLIAFLAVDWTWAVLMSIVLGCHALAYPGISALIGEITDRATRATVFAFQATVITIVVMLRGPLQGFIAESAGLRPLYLLGVVGAMVSFFMFWKFFPDVKVEKGKSERLYRSIDRIRGVMYGSSAMLGSLLGAHLWANLGSTSAFYIAGTAQIAAAFIALILIRDIKDEKQVHSGEGNSDTD